MNRYGLRAQRYYARWAPKALAEISDPETFFTELGELIQGQVLLISQEMESTLDPTAPYLERVSQLRAVQRDAEEVAMTDNVYRLVLPELQGQEQLMQILGDLPLQTKFFLQIHGCIEHPFLRPLIEPMAIDQPFLLDPGLDPV